MTNRHADERDRRAVHRELLAQFWEAADRMWRHSENYELLREGVNSQRNYPGLVGTVRTPSGLVDVRSPAEQARHEQLTRMVEERDAHRQALVEADSEAGVLVGRMRLLGLSIVPEAEELRTASRFVSTDKGEVHYARHDAALAAFEAKGADLND